MMPGWRLMLRQRRLVRVLPSVQSKPGTAFINAKACSEPRAATSTKVPSGWSLLSWTAYKLTVIRTVESDLLLSICTPDFTSYRSSLNPAHHINALFLDQLCAALAFLSHSIKVPLPIIQICGGRNGRLLSRHLHAPAAWLRRAAIRHHVRSRPSMLLLQRSGNTTAVARWLLTG